MQDEPYSGACTGAPPHNFQLPNDNRTAILDAQAKEENNSDGEYTVDMDALALWGRSVEGGM